MTTFTVSYQGQSLQANLNVQAAVLKKFHVHFRRPKDYRGKYGFDWLRDEYIYPIQIVTNDNNGTPIGAAIPLCKNIAALKAEYKTKNPISPYGKDYYPAWLAIFPHTTTAEFKHGSTIHKDGVSLDLEIEELEPLVLDKTEIVFETSNKFLKISPSKIPLKNLTKKAFVKSLGPSTIRDYYLAKNSINIKCKGGALTKHEEVKVFAQLGSQREEVGRLMVYKNDIIPKAEIVAVNVITSSSSKASLRDDYQYLFKRQSFNQALVRAEVKVDTAFNINNLPNTDASVVSFKSNYINTTSNIGTSKASNFKKDLIKLYEKYGKHKPASSVDIDSNSNKRTYLFYTTIKAQTSGYGKVQGTCSAKFNKNSSGVTTSITWGNAYVIFGTALTARRTVLHECGHSFSLPHVFQEPSSRSTVSSPFVFYKGFTDNIMDYVNQTGVRIRNPYEKGDKMNCFFKWQWDIIRKDRSLIKSY